MRGRSKEQLRFVVMAGGGLDMSARGWTSEELRFLAMAAAGSQHKPYIVLRDLEGITDEDLRFIAMAGQGCIVFSDR